jgi:hypothetical protein
MSRTIRRKNAIKHYWGFESWLHDTEWRQSKYGGEYQVRVKCGGKELKRRLAKLHSDHYPKCNIGNTPWSYRNVDHRRHRVKIRTAIANYLHNPEYVIMIRAQPKWDYWD